MTAPEFSRPIALDTIGDVPRTVTVEADEAERAALAARFGLASIARLAARATVSLRSGFPYAEGAVTAAVTQNCIVTGDPLPVAVEEPFALRFLPTDMASDSEVELDAAACDTMFHSGGAIDLGEAAAETLALALDPFPRGPGADAALKAAGVIGEDAYTPLNAFAALQALKKT
ncbi:YceD family protein [Sphingomonas flavalba]|uniref:YceD family protein n=1 Tax=Sphingomonas flavalba TaxID=2559804 RepID=UPI0039E180BA